MKAGALFAGLDFVCLQESKFASPSVTLKTIGGCILTKWLVLDAVDTASGVLLGWNENQFDCIDSHISIFSVSGVFGNTKISFFFLPLCMPLSRGRIRLCIGES